MLMVDDVVVLDKRPMRWQRVLSNNIESNMRMGKLDEPYGV